MWVRVSRHPSFSSMGSFPAGLRCVLCVPARGGIRTIGASFTHHAGAGFRPSKVVVVAKTTRYEFEQQRYRYAGLSEDDLKELKMHRKGCRTNQSGFCSVNGINEQFAVLKSPIPPRKICMLALKGSNYSGLLERYNIHTRNVQHIINSLRNDGIDVKLVKRREYDEETVRWADAIISAGGDGTMLLAAGKVLDRHKPVIGVNTDPERSQGHLCLPVRYTHSFPAALQKIYRGEFRWQWRRRIRLHLEGTGINVTPVDLHEEQLSLEQHSRAHRGLVSEYKSEKHSGQYLLPVRALNEVFIGESLSSRASYYEISVDDGPWEKQKSSGLNVSTGTGSKAWSYNINRLVSQTVEDVLKIAMKQENKVFPLSKELVEKVAEEYNDSLLYNPEEAKMLFSIREPIANRVFSCSQQRGFASKVCVRSRCWDACMVVDGGTSFEFNDGAIVSITANQDDALCTVVLDE